MNRELCYYRLHQHFHSTARNHHQQSTRGHHIQIDEPHGLRGTESTEQHRQCQIRTGIDIGVGRDWGGGERSVFAICIQKSFYRLRA